MKNRLLIFIFIFIFNLNFSQEKTMFKDEFKPYTLQCSLIANSIINKTKTSDFTNWFEGKNFTEKKLEFDKFESIIDKSESDITFYIQLVNENDLIYVISFYDKNSEQDFGIIYIKFDNKENNKVDDLKCINKEIIDNTNKIEIENNGVFIPPPPPPPNKTE